MLFYLRHLSNPVLVSILHECAFLQSMYCACAIKFIQNYTPSKSALVFNSMTYTPLLIVSEQVDAVCGVDNLAFRMKGSALS